MRGLVLLLLLAGCATQQPEYKPYTENQYNDWRQCRVDYENAHPPNIKSDVFLAPKDDNFAAGFATFMWGPAAGGTMNHSGPAMDKAVDGCMASKGYKRS